MKSAAVKSTAAMAPAAMTTTTTAAASGMGGRDARRSDCDRDCR
jgi:hypothetical protein